MLLILVYAYRRRGVNKFPREDPWCQADNTANRFWLWPVGLWCDSQTFQTDEIVPHCEIGYGVSKREVGENSSNLHRRGSLKYPDIWCGNINAKLSEEGASYDKEELPSFEIQHFLFAILLYKISYDEMLLASWWHTLIVLRGIVWWWQWQFPTLKNNRTLRSTNSFFANQQVIGQRRNFSWCESQ